MSKRHVFLGLILFALVSLACNLITLPRLVKAPDAATVTVQVEEAPDVDEIPTETIPTPVPDSMVGESQDQERVFNNVYERTNPGVVNVGVTTAGGQGSGSGFVFDGAGHVVTNEHVVENARRIVVTFYDGTQVEADVLATDSISDLAVIRVDVPSELLHPLPLGESDGLRVGQRVLAIGNPFSFQGTLTVGIISGLGRVVPRPDELGLPDLPNLIQTDAAINPGNSGGPLLNARGQAIGVNTLIFSARGFNTGVGFAIPANTVKRVVPALIDEGGYSHPWLGIEVDERVNLAELSQEFDVPVERGVLIEEVRSDGPAARAGLRGGEQQVQFQGHSIKIDGDIIVAIDGTKVRNSGELLGYLERETFVGQILELTVLRSGQERIVEVQVGERPDR